MDFEEQYDKIYRYAYYKMKQAEIAEDITQETFLRFLESDTYRNTGQALQYLYTIARNLCMDEFRKSSAFRSQKSIRKRKGKRNFLIPLHFEAHWTG